MVKIKCHYEGLSDCFIAGGAILSQITKSPINDWDIYPKSFNSIMDNLIYLLEEEKCDLVSYTDRAISLKSSTYHNLKGEREIIQIMIFDTFETPEKIFENFDFTVCMAAYDIDEQTFHSHPNFFEDVASRTLKVNPNTRFPHATLVRTKKYTQKGYQMPKSQYLKLGCMLNQIPFPADWKELEKAIGGSYGKLISLQTDGIEYTVDNVYEVLDNIDSDYTIDSLNIQQEEDTIFKMLKSKKDSEKRLALKIITNTEIPLLKVSGGWVFYDTDNNKISGDVVLFKNIDKPDEYNIKEYSNLLISGFVLVKEIKDEGTAKLIEYPHEFKIGELLKINNACVSIALDIPETHKNEFIKKGYHIMEVLVNSDDIVGIQEYDTYKFGKMFMPNNLLLEAPTPSNIIVKANRFKTMEIVK